MAVCPFAVDRLIPPGSSDPRISPRVAILHVDAGNTRDLHDYFDGPSGGIESHFQIALDGTIFQYRDTNYEADANYKANAFGISIETQGYGAGEWTAAQLASIKRLLVWLNQVHPAIRLAKVDEWDGSGIGYHVQFGAPGAWTPVAKSCPGPDRIKQYHNIIVPWLAAGAEQEDTMNPSQEALLKEAAADAKRARKVSEQTIKELRAFRRGKAKSDQAVRAGLAALVDETPDASREQVRRQANRILARLDELAVQLEDEAAAAATDEDEEVTP